MKGGREETGDFGPAVRRRDNVGACARTLPTTMQFLMKGRRSSAVSSSGGRLCLRSGGETLDAQEAVFEYSGSVVHRSRSDPCAGRRGGGPQFFRAKDNVTISRGGIEVTPAARVDTRDLVVGVSSGGVIVAERVAGGPRRPDTKPEPWIQPLEGTASELEQHDLHQRNFFDCAELYRRTILEVKTRRQLPIATHLVAMSVRVSRKLSWALEKEAFMRDHKAVEVLGPTYRSPLGRGSGQLEIVERRPSRPGPSCSLGARSQCGRTVKRSASRGGGRPGI